MSDFIREVDESYRQDQFQSFLKRHWTTLLLVVVLVLLAAGGWRFYQSWWEQQAEAAGARYVAAIDLAASDPKASIAALEAIGRDGPPGYRVLARFRAADETGKTDAAAAIKAFDAIAADADTAAELKDVARLRAGILSVDTADPAELAKRLEPLADANSAYRSVAREMLAVAALKRGDDAAAKTWLTAILSDPGAGLETRQRAGVFMKLIAPGSADAAPGAAAQPAPAGAPASAGAPSPAGAPAPGGAPAPEKAPATP